MFNRDIDCEWCANIYFRLTSYKEDILFNSNFHKHLILHENYSIEKIKKERKRYWLKASQGLLGPLDLPEIKDFLKEQLESNIFLENGEIKNVKEQNEFYNVDFNGGNTEF